MTDNEEDSPAAAATLLLSFDEPGLSNDEIVSRTAAHFALASQGYVTSSCAAGLMLRPLVRLRQVLSILQNPPIQVSRNGDIVRLKLSAPDEYRK
jgi:hypothetical protein